MNNIIPHEIYDIKIGFKEILKEENLEDLSIALEELVNTVSFHNKEATDGDNWEMSLTTIGKPDMEVILNAVKNVAPSAVNEESVSVKLLPEIDWLEEVHKNFPPVTIGNKFFVYGSHYKEEIPSDLLPLKIDAATAFGSGEHETTSGCVRMLDKLKAEGHDFKNALDMGCGSGILAIVIAKLWENIKITAIDIDPESIIVTKRHAEFNNVENKIISEAGDGYNAPLVDKNSPYDIIAANILANPLISMAPDLAKNLKEGGYCVLAGLLTRQKQDVIDAHVNAGLTLLEVLESGEWQILLMKK